MRIVFLDTSVFIWAYNKPRSNSAKLLELLDEGIFEGLTSEKALEELERYFTKFYNPKVWKVIRHHALSTVRVIPRGEILQEMEKWRSKIKEKDLEHLATVKALGVNTLVALDRDYEPFPEYMTPRKLLEVLGFRASETEY